ncbi:MAG TPA: hypothetical protein VJT82_10560 [Pyrinomonadaceae bacterium]|nr:hypothetical protein [Pyrinomonadaceae bacterium]
MLEAVTSSIKIGSHRRRRHFARATNALLLLLIFYGATFGLLHGHTAFRPSPATFGIAFDTNREVDLTAEHQASGKDCLLCQLHQQLSHGLVQTPPFALQPPATVSLPTETTFSYHSATDAPSRGRAPPSTSLL